METITIEKDGVTKEVKAWEYRKFAMASDGWKIKK